MRSPTISGTSSARSGRQSRSKDWSLTSLKDSHGQLTEGPCPNDGSIAVLAAAASKAGPGAILPRAPSKSSAGPARVEAQGAAAKGRNLNEAARYGEVFEEMKHLILLR